MGAFSRSCFANVAIGKLSRLMPYTVVLKVLKGIKNNNVNWCNSEVLHASTQQFSLHFIPESTQQAEMR